MRLGLSGYRMTGCGIMSIVWFFETSLPRLINPIFNAISKICFCV